MRIVILSESDYFNLSNTGKVKHVVDYYSLISLNEIVHVLYTDNCDIYQTDTLMQARVVDVMKLEYENMCKHKIVSLRVLNDGELLSEE